MNRLLLALLALFAGLLVQSTPAQARLGTGETEIGSTEQGRSAKPSVLQSQAADAPVVRQERRERDANRVRPTRARVYIPSVLFGADRAYE